VRGAKARRHLIIARHQRTTSAMVRTGKKPAAKRAAAALTTPAPTITKNVGGRPTDLEAASVGAKTPSIAAMFDGRNKLAANPAKVPAPFASDVRIWNWSGVDGDESIPQKALLGGDVLWNGSMLATPKAVGSAELEETYYVHKDDDDKVVEKDDPNANPNPRKRGGDGQLLIRNFGSWLAWATANGGEEIWVGSQYVRIERGLPTPASGHRATAATTAPAAATDADPIGADAGEAAAGVGPYMRRLPYVPSDRPQRRAVQASAR